MGKLTVPALRAVLVALFAGSVFVQAVMVPLLAGDLRDPDAELAAYQRTSVLVILVLGFVAVEVVLACVWHLVTMVRRGTVFSHGASRYVHIVTGAVVAAAVLLFVLAAVLAPGEAVAPGMVLLICGAAMAALGVALVVVLLRVLLAQAVDRDVEAAQLRSELDEVI